MCSRFYFLLITFDKCIVFFGAIYYCDKFSYGPLLQVHILAGNDYRELISASGCHFHDNQAFFDAVSIYQIYVIVVSFRAMQPSSPIHLSLMIWTKQHQILLQAAKSQPILFALSLIWSLVTCVYSRTCVFY